MNAFHCDRFRQTGSDRYFLYWLKAHKKKLLEKYSLVTWLKYLVVSGMGSNF
ncbi:MAG: hypothetical protein V7K40_26330 [Nostoc sp.]|uniref:hypothetical protein n=1 Tax=Nostoc sp. TaxID=1180 RepID=UPI002FF73252